MCVCVCAPLVVALKSGDPNKLFHILCPAFLSVSQLFRPFPFYLAFLSVQNLETVLINYSIQFNYFILIVQENMLHDLLYNKK